MHLMPVGMSKTKQPDISLSMPLFNEADCIEDTATELLNVFQKNGVDLELILVNNGSIDATGEIIDRLAKKDKRIKTLHFRKNQGFGGGILAGMRMGLGRYVGFTCGDGQITARETVAMYQKAVRESLDVCKSIRVKRYDGPKRWVISKIYNLMFRILFLKRYKDINGYPVMIRRELFQKMNLQSSRWMINVEILRKADQLRAKVGAMPVVFQRRRSGKGMGGVNIMTVIAFIKEIVKYRLTGRN